MKKPLYKQRKPTPVPDRFAGLIVLLRGQKVMLDRDLAALYGVTTKVLNQAVKRNLARFPTDFMFQLVAEEAELLRSQIVTSNPGRGGRRHLPFVFTEQGVAMLSSVLRSVRAVKVNIEIMRAFVRLRQLLAANADLERRLAELESRCDLKFKDVFEAIRELLDRPDPLQPEHGREIGFHSTQQLKEEAPAYRCFAPRKATAKTPARQP